jgi:esterase/lipase superfamily enzyme
LADSWHVAWLREGVKHWNGRRKKVKFKPDLSNLNFSEIVPSGDSRQSFFEGVNLASANMQGADLSNLSFDGSKFTYSRLEQANLSGASFEKCQFYRAKMEGVQAQGTSFQGASLRMAKMSEADLSGARFDGAALDGAEISADQVLSLESFEYAALPDEILSSVAVSRRIAYYNIRLAKTEPDGSGEQIRSPNEGTRIAIADSGRAAAEKVVYDVYFGTNRKPVIVGGAVRDYSGERNNEVDFGVCEVFIPKTHKIGSIGSPIWKRVFKGDDRLKISEVYQLNESVFWSLIRDVFKKENVQVSPTLFVHGYNNSFSQAVVRAAQIGRDLGLGTGIGLFSWPSKGKRSGYFVDEAAMEVSKYHLADFIENFIEQSPANGLNIIAHSMGCRCFLLALEILAQRSSKSLDKIEQIILAAADVDQGIMTQLGAHAVNHSKRSTCYVSTKDKAVEVSRWLRSFPRVGFCPPVFIMSGLDTVLVNNTDLTLLGHSYVGSSREVLSDIYHLLKSNTDPKDRFNVEAAGSVGNMHWKLKD